MKLIALALLGLATARIAQGIQDLSDKEYWEAWKDFLKIPGVKERTNMYQNKAEFDLRFEVFKQNVDKITAHNNQKDSWKMGVNQFTDMTPQEFRKYTSCVSGNITRPDASKFQATLSNKTVPSSVDWVAAGDVTPIKNQGQCGSCWAFSTTGVIESRTAIAGKGLTSLSEQQLVDCAGQGGCNGGWPDQALYYVYGDKGLCTENDYQYRAVAQGCYANSCSKYDPISTYAYVRISTQDMEAAVAAGPVSIVVDADWQNYGSGVYTANCGTNYDHAVLLVGYGHDSSSGYDYWKVKNSWGTWWGEEGYIRLCRNCGRNNGYGQCGILRYGVYPII